MTSPEHDTISTTSPFPDRDWLSTMTAKPAALEAVTTPVLPPRQPPRVLVDREEPLVLTVMTLFSDQAVVLVVTGDIDRDTAPVLDRALESAAVVGHALVVVDLSAVRLLACAGLTVLVAAHRRAGDRTCLRVVAAGRAARRPLELTGVDKWLNVYRTRAQALTPLPDSW